MTETHDTPPPPRSRKSDPPPPREQVVVGWREYVALPAWGAGAVKAKVDTGARTSAIDVANVQELDGNRVRFEIVTSRQATDKRIEVEADVVRRTRVKSSFGASHDRIIVRTRMILGPIDKEIELSLVSRRKMLCRMLLGRKALEPEMLVNPSRRYMHGTKRRRKNSTKAPPS